MKKHSFLIVLFLLIVGIVFLIWGTIIQYHYPEMVEARRIMWAATKYAGVQYLIGYGFLIAAYIQVSKK